MVTTARMFLRLRNVSRFHPLLGPGATTTPTSLESISMITGTPGRAPLTVPWSAVPLSRVTVPSLASWPDQVRTPEAGPVYEFRAAGCADEGRGASAEGLATGSREAGCGAVAASGDGGGAGVTGCGAGCSLPVTASDVPAMGRPTAVLDGEVWYVGCGGVPAEGCLDAGDVCAGCAGAEEEPGVRGGAGSAAVVLCEASGGTAAGAPVSAGWLDCTGISAPC